MPDGTWKREGPPIMMVSLGSARLWYPREQLVACSEDHSQIAKLKRGESSIYKSVWWAIKKALLSAGHLYSEAKGIHHDESSNLGSADEISAMRRSLLQAKHPQSSMPSDDLTADRAPGPSRSPSEDVVERRLPQVGVEQFAHHGDTQSKNNLFNETVPQRRTGIKDSEWDDTRPSADPRNPAETDMASILLDEDIAASKSTELTTPLGAESTTSNETKEETSPAPERSEVGEDTALQTEDLNISTNGTKSMIMDEVMKSAIEGGDEAKTRELIAHCYDINCKDEGGITPLLLAASYKHENILRLLLEKGAHPSTRCDKGNTTLHWLTSIPEIPITETLIDLLLRNRPPFEVANGEGVTPLMNACLDGETMLATRLISHGADIHATDSEGRAALYLAAREGQLEIVKVLLDHGANIEAPNKNGRRPLHVAAQQAQLEVVKALLDHGANVEAPDQDAWRPLHLAACNDQLDVVKALLDHGANIEAPNKNGRRPLHVAAQQAQLEVVKALLDYGANIEASTKVGSRPLHIAAWNGQLSVVKTLLDHGANVEAPNSDGERPLHYAAKYGYLEIIKVLLDHGANPTVRTTKLVGSKPSGVSMDDSVSSEQKQAVRALLKEAERTWKQSH